MNKEKLNAHRFYLFTDGLSESLDKNKNELGIKGTKETINNNFNSSLEVELTSITKEIIDNSEKNKLTDDLTVVVIGK